jgi:flagellar assembly factor FliW
MTANLAAPILINSIAGKGCQVLAEGDDYQIRQPVFEVLLKKSEEDG